MKRVTDYIFADWPRRSEGTFIPNEEYFVLADVGELRKNERVRFVGFADVDNHYGIFVFTNAEGKVLEVSGDFSGPTHSAMVELRAALAKA